MENLIVIIYTTKYRKGGDKFARVAKTMASNLESESNDIICTAVESKKEIKDLFTTLKQENKLISEFHFIGHAGMYGPMYGTVSYPEQFSPFELNTLDIPFGKSAKAYFHTCRSARWFAPYFSRINNVTTYGYHWYTAFSLDKDRFKINFKNNPEKELYCFGCKGRKSHGYIASFKKIAGLMRAEKMVEFNPSQRKIDNTYDTVVNLYHNAFKNIKVRKDEYNWIVRKLPKDKRIKMLDIGCGNGALLRELSNRIENGIGVDASENFISLAKDYNKDIKNINFQKIDSHLLPFEDNSFDVVISMLSFRYLDWDPILIEIERVLSETGKLLIVDMVTAPIKWKEIPLFVKYKTINYINKYKNREFSLNLNKLVSDSNWKNMLKYNPIRSEHEMRWYLESRFPNRKAEIINLGYNTRILAFDSINMSNLKKIKLSYP